MTASASATRFPRQPNLAQANIAEELTEFDIAEPGTAWWIRGGEWNRDEYLYRRTPIDEGRHGAYADDDRSASGVHVSIHEAALVDYSGMDLRRVEGTRFKASAVAVLDAVRRSRATRRSRRRGARS